MMALKQPLFIGKRQSGPDDPIPYDDRESADRVRGEEAGGQRGAAYYDDPNAEIDLLDDGARPARGRVRSGIALVAALAVFAGILWYAYDWGMGQFETADLPVIVADTTPIKSRPEDPGGIEVPNQDVAVLNDPVPDPAKPQAERLLPPPETPPQAEAPPSAPAAEAEELLRPPPETAAVPAVKAPAAKVALPPETPQVAPEATPDSVLPVPVPVPEAAPEPVTPEVAAAQPAPDPPAPPAAAPASETPTQVADPVVAAPVTAPVTGPVTAPVAPQAAALPEAKTGGFVVQLISIRSRDRARPAWANLQKAHPALLGNRELSIQKADLGDRGVYYRVRAGFFAERASARGLCNALKTRGQDCLVTKR